MWNMSESDRKYYKRQEMRETRINNTLDKAKYRAKILKKYLEDNNLESASQMEQANFNKLMRQADNDFNCLQQVNKHNTQLNE